MKIKLAVFDLDGTLLDSKNNLREETISALNCLQHTGTKLMICSGRAPSMARAYWKEVGVPGLLCCAGGSYLEDETGHVRLSCPMEQDTLDTIIPALRCWGAEFSLMTHNYIYSVDLRQRNPGRFQAYNVLAKKHSLYTSNILRDLEQLHWYQDKIYKIAVLESCREKLSLYRTQLQTLNAPVEVIQSGATVLDVLRKGCSKGQAVAFAAQLLGIKNHEIFCIGDHENDISMFQKAGLSVAMGNAPPQVKAAADETTSSNDHDGVAKAIRKYLL